VTRTWATILLAGIGTFTMRAAFLANAHRMARLSPALLRVLRQIPPAALAALVLPAVFLPEGAFDPVQARVPAAALAALVAWRTRNAALTLLVGMAALVLLEWR
jgi:branched-subunit amino acid transport protein